MMKGFEVNINDEAPVLAVCDDIVTIIIKIGYYNRNHLRIGGMDSKDDHLIWLRKTLKLGDKIKVRIVEIDTVSPLSEKYPSDREEMKKEYYKLKKQLEEEGKL